MDYNKTAQEILRELKQRFRRTDSEIASRIGISRQAYLRRRDLNHLTTEDITILSAWLVTAMGGGFYMGNFDLHYIVKLDGDKWIAHYNDFTNLQETNEYAFGDYPQEALQNFIDSRVNNSKGKE